MASDYSIAYQDVEGEFLQSQTNGPNSFNNSQNQLVGEAKNDAPVIITDVNNDAIAGTWASGFAITDDADAEAENENQTTQIPVAVTAAVNLGAALNGTETEAEAEGGEK